MRTSLLIAAAILSTARCGPVDSRCRPKPEAGANFGTCAEVIGAYFDQVRNTCQTASGCACDASCRAQVPFETVEECEQICR